MSEEAKVRLFGIYRTDWTDPAKAKFVERIAKTLYRRGAMTTGALRAYVRAEVQGDDFFQEALKALTEWRAITVTKRPWGNAYVAEPTPELVVELTKNGDFWAFHAVCDEQIAQR
jgi:hypothetical protein